MEVQVVPIEKLFLKRLLLLLLIIAMSQFVRIDNCIVEKFSASGICVGPIRLYEKRHKVKLVLDEIPYVSTGSKRTDSLLMQRLLSGSVLFDDLDIVFPNPPYILK